MDGSKLIALSDTASGLAASYSTSSLLPTPLQLAAGARITLRVHINQCPCYLGNLVRSAEILRLAMGSKCSASGFHTQKYYSHSWSLGQVTLSNTTKPQLILSNQLCAWVVFYLIILIKSRYITVKTIQQTKQCPWQHWLTQSICCTVLYVWTDGGVQAWCCYGYWFSKRRYLSNTINPSPLLSNQERTCVSTQSTWLVFQTNHFTTDWR